MYLKETQQKNKDGTIRRYLQIVETHRINGGQPRQKVLVNLGRCDTEAGKERLEQMAEAIIEASQHFSLLDTTKDLKAEWTKEYGPALIFKRLWEELGLNKVLLKEFSNINAEFDIESAIFNMVLNRLTDPSAKRQLEFWQDRVHGIDSFEPQHYYRALDYLIEHKNKVEEGIFIWDDCEIDCLASAATGKANENYTWAIFKEVE